MKRTITYSLLIVFFCSCVTTKSRTDQSKLAQFYHNLTSEFNGYFNANELMEESILRLEDQYVDNYNELLPLHEWAAVDNADAVKSDLDEAIKKVSLVVRLHEYSDFVDDCYLLIAKAEFMKQDYETAENDLEFFMDEFKPNGKRYNVKPKKKAKRSVKSKNRNTGARKNKGGSAKATRASKKAAKERKRYNKQVRNARKKAEKGKKSNKKKKKKEEPVVETPPVVTDAPVQKDISAPKSTEKDGLPTKAPKQENLNGMLGHRPAYNEALLWLARTYIERENYIAADYNLIKLEKNGDLYNNVARELPVIRALYNIRRLNYEGAIERLENAIELSNKRQLKARYAFIIAQLYEKLQNEGQAAEFYDRVISFNPDYEMEFNAKLKKMVSGMASGNISNSEAESKLKKMVKDFKNEEYLDQIYYSLAKIAVANNDIPLAIEHLVASVESKGKLPAQKTESNYLLAELYYQQESYIKAKSAYDAALTTMKEEDERYAYTKLLADNLTDIAKNLEIIAEQDSLIKIAMLSPEEREAMAMEIQKEKEKAASIAEANKLNSDNSDKRAGRTITAAGGGGLPGARNANYGSNTESSFFAFNPKLIKRGQKDFEKDWGEIKLTDNWRVQSKVTSNLEDETDNEIAENTISEKEVKDLFSGVPSTPEDIEKAHGEIRKAMLTLGTLYREKLEDYENSSESLIGLLNKYPDAPEKLQTYYELYLTYLSAGENAKAEIYKQKILDEFGGSKFAKALSDPSYSKNYISESQKLINYYDSTYTVFERGDIAGTFQRINKANAQFGNSNPLSSKFALLEAFATGKRDGKDAYVESLKNVISKFPRTEEEKKARDILLVIGASTSGKTFGAKGLNKARFVATPEKPHFVMVYIKNQSDINLSEAKISISKYNREYHNLDKIRITSVTFDPETKESIILLRSFQDAAKAKEYTDGAFRKKQEFLMPDADFVAYPVTQNNYREIIKARSVEDYEVFYNDNY